MFKQKANGESLAEKADRKAAAVLDTIEGMSALTELYLIHSGLESCYVTFLHEFGFTRTEIALITGVSMKTIQRLEQSLNNLDVVEGERVIRFLKALGLQMRVHGTRLKTLKLLRTPLSGLGELTALQVMQTDSGVRLLSSRLLKA